MTQLLIYDEPVVLNRTRHRDLRLNSRPVTFGFAAALNSVPLTVPEFTDAARDYPIVFAGGPDQVAMPAALLGLADSENLFVAGDGHWDAHAYIPAFLRRYPFVVATQQESDEFNVCLERAWISEGEDGVPLFDEEGRETPTLDHAKRFLADYQGAVKRTQVVMQQLRDNDLLIERSINIERPGQPPRALNGFRVVDEPRLAKLTAKVLKGLMRNGTLGLIYVHLASLGNVQRLAQRTDARAQPTEGDSAPAN